MPLSVALLDNFNRANAPIGSGVGTWTGNCWADGAQPVKIVSNAAVFEIYGTACNTALSLDGAQDIEIGGPILLPSGATYTLGLGIIRQAGAAIAGQADGYSFAWALNGTITPIKFADGVETDLATSSLTYQAGDIAIFRRRASDGRMQLIRDRAGVETVAATWTDTTLVGPFYVVLSGFDQGNTAGFTELYAGNVGATVLINRGGTVVVGP